MHFYSWKKGLKTGMYYLRTRPAVDAIQFTVDQLSIQARIKSSSKPGTPSKNKPTTPIEIVGEVCTFKDGCLTCGS